MTARRARDTIPSNSPVSKANVRSDGELYARPEVNPFSENWLDGYQAGYDNEESIKSEADLEWRDGFFTGRDGRDFDREEMDRANSSNT